MSEENARYFQFPLRSLAFGDTVQDRLDHIVSFCVCDVGVQAWDKLSDSQKNAIYEGLADKEGVPSDLDAENDEHRAVLYGGYVLNVVLGSVLSTIQRWKKLRQYITLAQNCYGRDVDVRIRADIFWDAKSGEMPYRQFSVLAALYSAIGSNKGPVRVTREMLMDRALGYKSKAAVSFNRKDSAERLTTKQLRVTLDTLENRGFFSRINPSPRKAFFSNKLSPMQLATAVAERETKQLSAKLTRQGLNRSVQKVIEDKKKEIQCANP